MDPGGSTAELFHAVLAPGDWTATDMGAVLACLGYIMVFSVLGIRFFRWDTH